VRVVIAPGAFGDTLGAAAAADAIATGWRRAAPGDDLALLPAVDGCLAGLDAMLDGAGLAITGGGSFDWRSLRDTHVTAVARSAAARGVPCVVLAGQVLVGRREAAAVGVDAAYAITDGAGGLAAVPAVVAGGRDVVPAGEPGGAGGQPAVAADALAALAATVARRWSRSVGRP
jgi:glycerate 2-kinase